MTMNAKRTLSIVLTLLLCIGIMPTAALAVGTSSITVCGNAWDASTYAVITDHQIITEGATEENYNLHWNAETATLTLRNVQLPVTDMAAVTGEIELLTIHLIGQNTISAENSRETEDYAVISNTKRINITGEADSSLTVTVNQKENMDTAAISAGSGITNSAAVDVEVTVGASVKMTNDLYGLKCGVDNDQPGFLENSGNITVKVNNNSLFCGTSADGFSIYIPAGAMHNTGTLNMTASATNGNVYGLRGSSTKELWNNEGIILSHVTAYGGNCEGFDEDTYKGANHACAVSVVTGSSTGIEMINSGTMDLYAVNYALNQGRYEYAIGLELDSSTTSFTNSGTVDIDALEAYTWGIYLSNLTDDATLRNSGDITVRATTSGRMVDYYQVQMSTATGIGINMTSFDSDPNPVKTEMILEPGSRLNISVGTAECTKGDFNEAVAGMTYEQWRQLMLDFAGISADDEITYEAWVDYQCCQGIQLQKLFYNGDPGYTEVPQDISISDELVILEGEGPYDGGELVAVFEDYYVPMGIWLYINTIGNYFTDPAGGDPYSMPSKNITILPKLTGMVNIEGTAQVGSTLTAKVEGLPENVNVTYQWQSGDTAEGPFEDIQDATKETYQLTNSETGKYVRVVVLPAGNDYGSSLSASTESAVRSAPSESTSSTYPPTVKDSDGGKTTITPRYPVQGDTVTITTKPEDGKEVDQVIVTDRSGDRVEVTDHGNGTYSFTQPNGKVTIEVTYRDTKCAGGTDCPTYGYNDLDINAWYHEAVDYAVEHGLMAAKEAEPAFPERHGNTDTGCNCTVALGRKAGHKLPNEF